VRGGIQPVQHFKPRGCRRAAIHSTYGNHDNDRFGERWKGAFRVQGRIRRRIADHGRRSRAGRCESRVGVCKLVRRAACHSNRHRATACLPVRNAFELLTEVLARRGGLVPPNETAAEKRSACLAWQHADRRFSVAIVSAYPYPRDSRTPLSAFIFSI
jgi:hypothetical protein